jgi:hypothetical protein
MPLTSRKFSSVLVVKNGNSVSSHIWIMRLTNGPTRCQSIVSGLLCIGINLFMLVPVVRWNESRLDDVSFLQSAAIHAHYYFLQILIHRPFIPYVRDASALSVPSLMVCTSAARSCTYISSVVIRRFPWAHSPVFHVRRILLAPYLADLIVESSFLTSSRELYWFFVFGLPRGRAYRLMLQRRWKMYICVRLRLNLVKKG